MLRAEFEKYYLPDDFQALLTHSGFGALLHTTTVAFSGSCGGHQIPDVVYMALVDWLLDAPSVVEGNLVAAVRAAYQANMTALHTMFDTLEQEHEEYTRPDSPVLSAVAAAAVYSKSSYNTLAMLVSFRERRHPGLTGVTGLPFPLPQDMATVEALAPCADLDGDGFSNAGEWLYFDWTLDRILASAGNWTGSSSVLLRIVLGFIAFQPGQAVYVPEMANHLERPGAPPTVTVTIAREGDGGVVYPSPGIHTLPMYRLTDWWVRDAAGNYVPRADACAACAFAELVVDAKPQGDYVLAKWRGVGIISGDATEREVAPGVPRNPVHLSLEWPHNISAVFKARPGVGDLDLLADVAAFYLATNVCTVEQFYGNVVDFGGTGDTEYPTGLGEAFDDYLLAMGIGRRFTGNGIPDAAEIALLQAVLDNPAQRTTVRGEASFSMTWDEFSDNLAQARTDFPFLSHDAQRGVAVFTCLGNYGHAALIAALAQGLYSFNVVPSDYATTCREHFAPGGDADGDGVTNLAEWRMVEDASHEGENETDAAALRCEYVKFAMTEDGGALQNPNQGDDYDNDPDPDQNNEAICGCWNDNCEPNFSLGIFKGYSNTKFGEIPASCRVIYENKESSSQQTHTTSGPEGAQPDPKECDTNKEHAADKIISVQSGLTVKVKADESDGFEYWYAPGTPIHGSKEAKETFSMPGGGVTIQPHENLHYIAIDGKGYEVECTPGKDSEYVRLFYTPAGVLWQIAAREGATVTLSLKNGYTAEWLAIDDGVGGNRICETIGNSVTIAFFNYLFMDMPDKIEVGMVYPIPGFVGPPMDGAMSEGGVAVVGFGSRVATGFLYANAYRMPGTSCSGCGASPDWRISPFRGYELIDYYVNISTRPCKFWNNGLEYTCTEFVSGCVEGEFKKMPTLTVKQKIVDCNGGGKKSRESPSCAGYVLTDPAVKYHTRGSYVNVTAVPRAGFIFVGWEGIPKGYGTGINLMTSDADKPYDIDRENTVTDNSISFLINDDLEVTALYTRPYGCDRYIMPDF
ncbi:MAG: hypothetical protein H3C30_08245 [Candidatus Hydrogenedentes bacterium]|nr:hypothetical protein [Candidatus Hydrogenedentota bacterium]